MKLMPFCSARSAAAPMAPIRCSGDSSKRLDTAFMVMPTRSPVSTWISPVSGTANSTAFSAMVAKVLSSAA